MPPIRPGIYGLHTDGLPLTGSLPMEYFGSPRFLGSPLVPLPCSRTPAAPPHLAFFGGLVLSPLTQRRRPQRYPHFRGSITQLRHLLSTLPDSAFPTLAKLASGGWLTFTGWDSNPLDSYGEFQKYLLLLLYSNTPGFAWRDVSSVVKKRSCTSCKSSQKPSA